MSKPVAVAWAETAEELEGRYRAERDVERRRPHGTLLADLPVARVRQPPYSPELDPAERVFQEVRRRVEGRCYDAVADKQARADAYLAELAADPARVTQLCGWDWLTNALNALPTP